MIAATPVDFRSFRWRLRSRMTSNPVPHQKDPSMIAVRQQCLLAVVVAGALAIPSARAQQFPIPTTAADVSGPAPGTAITPAYVQTVGRMAYLWGWPLVNMANRADAFSK